MSARKKLNSLYTGAAVVAAGYLGLVFNSWWAFGIVFGLIMLFNAEAGNTRWAPSRR